MVSKTRAMNFSSISIPRMLVHRGVTVTTPRTPSLSFVLELDTTVSILTPLSSECRWRVLSQGKGMMGDVVCRLEEASGIRLMQLRSNCDKFAFTWQELRGGCTA